MYLADAKISLSKGKKYLSILVAYSDNRHPDGVVSDPKKNKRRTHSKSADEGDEYSCHLVISMHPILSGGRMFYMAFEQIPRFSTIQLERYLKRIFRVLVAESPENYTFPDPGNTAFVAELIGYRVKLELSAVPSEQLQKDLESGELGHVELVREMPGVKGWDENNFTVDQRRILVLKPTEKALDANIWDFIKGVCKSGASKHYDFATLRWKAGLRGYTAKFDCATENMLTTRYVKKAEFNFDYRLPASCEKIDPGFESRLIKWIG